MTVSWATLTTTGSEVQFGPTPQLGNSVSGTFTSYLPNSTYHHHVYITGLEPASTYYYRCGDVNTGFSPVMNFKTAPLAGTEFPFTIAAYGDMGRPQYHSANTLLDLQRIFPDLAFIWHVGDISYADDAFLHDPFRFEYENAWDQFMDNITEFASSKAYMVLPGNHEAECHSPVCLLESSKRIPLANFSAYNHRFSMPSWGSDEGVLNMWYSFDYGSVHFVQIDTETDYPNSPNDQYSSQNGGFGNQLAWLQADLADAYERRKQGEVTWILVGGHRPVYSIAELNGNAPGGHAADLQAAVEEMFYQYQVDMYVCGHVHATEAQWPVFNTTQVVQTYNNPPYTTYVVVGGAGCDEGLTQWDNSDPPAWNRFNDNQDYGLTTIDFKDKDTLVWTFRNSVDGSTLDTFTLTRKH